MGARVYLPELGQFTSADPVYGGNTNTYNCPINGSDLSGDLGGGAWCGTARGSQTAACRKWLQQAGGHNQRPQHVTWSTGKSSGTGLTWLRVVVTAPKHVLDSVDSFRIRFLGGVANYVMDPENIQDEVGGAAGCASGVSYGATAGAFVPGLGETGISEGTGAATGCLLNGFLAWSGASALGG